MITIEETLESGKVETSKNDHSVEKNFKIMVIDQAEISYNAALVSLYQWIGTHLPWIGAVKTNGTQGVLSPSDFSLAPIAGTKSWDATVKYTKRKRPSQRPMEYSASTKGGTAHITQSLETVRSVLCSKSTYEVGGSATSIAAPEMSVLSISDSGVVRVSIGSPSSSPTWMATYVSSVTVEVSTDGFATSTTLTGTTVGVYMATGIDTTQDISVRAKFVATQSDSWTDSAWTCTFPDEDYCPDFGGGIGYNEDGTFEGCEKIVPHFHWTETHYFPFSFYTEAYRTILDAMTGSINSTTFRGFPASTVLFEGSDISLVSDTDAEDEGKIKYYWKISYDFSTSPNATLQIGSSLPFTKEGWHYLWIYRKNMTMTDSNESRHSVMRPHSANVERIYLSLDFSSLLLPTELAMTPDEE